MINIFAQAMVEQQMNWPEAFVISVPVIVVRLVVIVML